MNSKGLQMIGNTCSTTALSFWILWGFLLLANCYGMLEKTNSVDRLRIQENDGIRESSLREDKRQEEEIEVVKRPTDSAASRGVNRGTQITVEASGYTCGPESTGKQKHDPDYCVTASGYRLRPGDKVVAMGAKYPFGTQVMIPGYGLATVKDRGGSIGNKHIDLYFERLEDALKWGRKTVNVTLVSNAGDK